MLVTVFTLYQFGYKVRIRSSNETIPIEFKLFYAIIGWLIPFEFHSKKAISEYLHKKYFVSCIKEALKLMTLSTMVHDAWLEFRVKIESNLGLFLVGCCQVVCHNPIHQCCPAIDHVQLTNLRLIWISRTVTFQENNFQNFLKISNFSWLSWLVWRHTDGQTDWISGIRIILMQCGQWKAFDKRGWRFSGFSYVRTIRFGLISPSKLSFVKLNPRVS